MSLVTAEPSPSFTKTTRSTEHYRKLEDFKVQHATVHSLAVDPETHRVYTPEQEENGKPVAHMVVYEAVPGK